MSLVRGHSRAKPGLWPFSGLVLHEGNGRRDGSLWATAVRQRDRALNPLRSQSHRRERTRSRGLVHFWRTPEQLDVNLRYWFWDE